MNDVQRQGTNGRTAHVGRMEKRSDVVDGVPFVLGISTGLNERPYVQQATDPRACGTFVCYPSSSPSRVARAPPPLRWNTTNVISSGCLLFPMLARLTDTLSFDPHYSIVPGKQFTNCRDSRDRPTDRPSDERQPATTTDDPLRRNSRGFLCRTWPNRHCFTCRTDVLLQRNGVGTKGRDLNHVAAFRLKGVSDMRAGSSRSG